jgi:hypothetical protein
MLATCEERKERKRQARVRLKSEEKKGKEIIKKEKKERDKQEWQLEH